MNKAIKILAIAAAFLLLTAACSKPEEHEPEPVGYSPGADFNVRLKGDKSLMCNFVFVYTVAPSPEPAAEGHGSSGGEEVDLMQAEVRDACYAVLLTLDGDEARDPEAGEIKTALLAKVNEELGKELFNKCVVTKWQLSK